MRMVFVFIVGKYYNPDGSIDSVWKNKQSLLFYIKKGGYRFSKEQDVWLNDKYSKWAKIEKHEIKDK